MMDEAQQDRDKKPQEANNLSLKDKLSSVSKERLRTFIKKKLNPVHQEVIAPPGQ